jgi:hypothetical protein
MNILGSEAVAIVELRLLFYFSFRPPVGILKFLRGKKGAQEAFDAKIN